ncbi:hypothetical protein [Bacillus sp. FJAT-44742]|nr:hypothetical protein [Bacillus sp. FJAT-44742]
MKEEFTKILGKLLLFSVVEFPVKDQEPFAAMSGEDLPKRSSKV